MTTDHPITPPPELVREWQTKIEYCSKRANREAFVVQVFQLGADAELEACCEWVNDDLAYDVADRLRTARRPKPPSLKEQALETLRQIPIDPEAGVGSSDLDIIRRALEALPE